MSSRRLITRSLLALLLPPPSLSQNSPQCQTLAPQLTHNASASLPIPALYLTHLGADTTNVRFNNEPDFSWRLSSYIQPRSPTASPAAGQDDTETVLWLDTAESNVSRLGQSMRMCHNVVPLQLARNVTWSKQTLRRSVHDTGDCRGMLGEACLARLSAQYEGAASRERSERSGCAGVNHTVPWECEGSGMVEAVSRATPDFNASLAGHFGHPSLPLLANSSAALLEDPLVCDGRNFSRSFGSFATVQDYDVGTNFPLMDIMMFFPTVRPGRVFRADMQRVQIVCLVPGQVTEGSREKASVESVLEKYASTGGNETSGARALRVVEVWRLLAWMVGVGFVFTVYA